MRRIIGGFLTFLVLTGTFLVLPVYAAPSPEVAAVEPSITEVPLGSVSDPAAEAVVVTDGSVVAAGPESDVVAGAVVEPAVEEAAAEEGAVEEGAVEPAAPTEQADEGGAPVPSAGADGDPVVALSGDEVAGVPVLSLSRPEASSFSAVGVTWAHDPAATSVTTRIRVQHPDGAWGDWTTLEQDDVEQTGSPVAGAGVRDGTAPYFTGPAQGVEVVVQAADGSAPADVRTQLIDPGTSAADGALGAAGPQDQAGAALSMPSIITRAQWGADESIRSWDPEYAPTIRAATIHHTADTNDYTADQVPAMMRSIYAFHTLSRGWGDIGYNVIVDKFGRIWEGRYGGLSSTVIGAHAGGFNTGTFGVSMLGNYDVVAPPQAMVDAVESVIAWKFSLYGVDPNGTTRLTSGGGGTAKYAAGTQVTLPTIFGHRDVGNTSCPGQYGYARLAEIRAGVTAALSASSNPVGAFDSISVEGQWVTVRGWATDPDTTGAVTMHVYANGANVVAVVAADRSADGVTGAHAYQASFPLVFGTHTVCVYALNVGPGTTNPHLGCRSVVVDPAGFNPTGTLDPVGLSGRQATVSGWAADVDATGPVVVHLYVDGRPVQAVVADRPTGQRGNRGYQATLQLGDGAHSVCAYAINVGIGTTNTHLGCRSVQVSMTPTGSFDVLTSSGRAVTLSGWAVDPDAPSAPVQVHVYIDGNGAAVLSAGRPEHSGHGFAATLPLSVGTHSVCTYAINVGEGASNTHLGCRTITVSMDPVGSLTAVSRSGIQAQVTGWASDPDTPAGAVQVHVYLDGVPVTATSTGATVDPARPGQGYDVWIPIATPGAHSVCTYAINVGEGTANTHLGCSTVTTPATAYDPAGRFDPLVPTGPSVRVSGTAGDPDAGTPVQVHVYVDGVGRAVLLATGAPTTDGQRAFTGVIPLPVGSHEVCTYAINQGQGTTNPHLGCRRIEVPASAFNPVGALSSVTASGNRVTAAGWASDPDAPASPLTVHVYVDGAGAAIVTADRTATGVDGAHAYAVQLTLPAGAHQVCTYGINVGTGTSNTHLGCRSVSV